MAGARNWDVRLPGDPPAEVPEPWFIRQAREGSERQASRTLPDWPEELLARAPGERVADEPGPPPPPDAARKAALQAVMIDTARQRAFALRIGAAALVMLVVAIGLGWTLRGFIEPTAVSSPQFIDEAPAAMARSEFVPVAPVSPRPTPRPSITPPEVAPIVGPAPVEQSAAPREVEPVVAAPAPEKIVAAPRASAQTRTESAAPRPVAPALRRESAPRAAQRVDPVPAPVAVAAAPRQTDPACAPSAPRGLRFVCGDAMLGALNRDYIDASARVAALDDPAEVRRLARDNQRFIDRRDRCDDAGCVADRYEDRLEAVEARLRRVERREAKTSMVTEGGEARLPECKGFQYFRPTTPCTSRRGARQ